MLPANGMLFLHLSGVIANVDCSVRPEFPERRQAVYLIDERDQRNHPVTVGFSKRSGV